MADFCVDNTQQVEFDEKVVCGLWQCEALRASQKGCRAYDRAYGCKNTHSHKRYPLIYAAYNKIAGNKLGLVRKPTRDITVNIFPQGFFYFRKFFFISARFFLFPQGFFFISARFFFYFRKVFFFYLRKVFFSARFILFPQGYFHFPEVWLSLMPISLQYCSKRAITPNDLGLPVPWWLPLKIFSRKLK